MGRFRWPVREEEKEETNLSPQWNTWGRTKERERGKKFMRRSYKLREASFLKKSPGETSVPVFFDLLACYFCSWWWGTPDKEEKSLTWQVTHNWALSSLSHLSEWNCHSWKTKIKCIKQKLYDVSCSLRVSPSFFLSLWHTLTRSTYQATCVPVERAFALISMWIGNYCDFIPDSYSQCLSECSTSCNNWSLR